VARRAEAAKPASTTRALSEGHSWNILNEVAGVVTLGAALFALVSFLSFHPGQRNLGGLVGYGLAAILLHTFGLAAYLIPLLLVLVGIRVFRAGVHALSGPRAVAALLLILTTSVGAGLILPTANVLSAGGWFGGFISALLRDLAGSAGALLIAGASMLFALMFTTGHSLRSASVAVRGSTQGAVDKLRERRSAAAVQAPQGGRRRDAARGRPAPLIVLRDEIPPPAPVKARRPAQEVLPFASDAGYQLPPLTLLDEPGHATAQVDQDALRRSSEILEAKLANFGIEGKVVAVRPGPVITTFEIEPAPGVKVNRIVTLQDDLAMALRAMSVRILAPVPGKAVVGIEVANTRREHVYAREIIESEPFGASPSVLTLALGKDSAGNPFTADLARMPHLLMAGATGTGKSVSLNAMIMSMLFKSTPRDVRFVMIDLKMLELSLYEDLPQLLVPVVTDPKKAVVVLKNLAEQMDQRYRLLKEKGVRNIDSYNRVLEEDGHSGLIDLTEVVDEDDVPIPDAALRHEHLPKIVVIIDELADLMMTAGRQVEEPITRLAQKARACGMHLILATQRPSVDVITGLIKANFPARISFQVTSRVDSRTILDSIGAERLLGGGDMLFLPPGTARVQRLHGAFVSEAEIKKVTQFAKQQAKPNYALDLLEGEEDDAASVDEEDYDDTMYDQAVRLVTESRQASISWVQRRLRVGYNRAARLIERMEREGVVTRSENGRPREVLAAPLQDS
jgi:S-DNA-T family DNA segregation ATPase FtsK/SpoIIIE